MPGTGSPPPPPQLDADEAAAAAALAKCVFGPYLSKARAYSDGGDDHRGGASAMSETRLLREVDDEQERGCVAELLSPKGCFVSAL